MSRSRASSIYERGLVPVAPVHIGRYDGSNRYIRRHMALPSKRSTCRQLPPGWEKYVHPEGQPYYFHPEYRILTEANVEAKHTVAAVLGWHDRIRPLAEQNGKKLTERTELVIELDSSVTPETCRYYLVECSERRVFWFGNVDTETLNLDMAVSGEHLDIAISEQFWTHLEYFPNHNPLPKGADEDLIAVLTHASIGKASLNFFQISKYRYLFLNSDQITSELSTSPWTAAECERFLKLLYNLKESPEKTCIVARLWRTTLHSRFINLYGSHGARLSRTQSVLPEFEPRPSLALNVLSRTLLCKAAEIHSEALKELWVDKVVYAEHWCMFMKGLKRDWIAAEVLGALLLSVNISFLSTTESDDIGAVACILSTLFSLSSLLSAFLLTRQHRDAESYNASRAGQYLESTFDPYTGHQQLAIIFSLPYALVLWSLLALVVTILTMVYASFNSSLKAVTGVGCFSATFALGLILYWSTVGFWRKGR